MESLAIGAHSEGAAGLEESFLAPPVETLGGLYLAQLEVMDLLKLSQQI